MRVVSSAAAIVTTQGITAGGSLVMQVIAARELGLAGYGAFAVCVALLTTSVALYSGYIGDALTVLDRHDRSIRAVLVSSAATGLSVAFVVAAGLVLVLDLGDWRVALIYGGMMVAWLVEETGRRILIARLQYWRLVCNDAAYVGMTFVTLILLLAAGRELTLGLMLASMAIGCGSAALVALVQLPSSEYRKLSLGDVRAAGVARFAIWRSMQATLRPTQLLVARILLLQLVSLSAVGAIEAGRLVVAPMQMVLNGAAAFLISTGAAEARRDRAGYRRNGRVAAGLVALTLSGGALASAASHPLGELMTGGPVPHLLVLGWAAYFAMWAASLPFTAELTVRKLSRPVFLARLVETVAGLGLVAAVLSAGGSSELIPWLLAASAFANTWWIRRLAVRSRTDSAAPQVAASGEPAIA